jgi:hypothetical protein
MGLVILGSWQQGERKYSGGEAGSRAGGWRGAGHFCFVFRNEHTLRRAIQYSKKTVSYIWTDYTTVPSTYLCPREESGVLFFIHLGNLSHFRCLFLCFVFLFRDQDHVVRVCCRFHFVACCCFKKRPFVNFKRYLSSGRFIFLTIW